MNGRKQGWCINKCAECEKATDGQPTQYILDSVGCYKKVSSAEFLNMSESAIRMLAEDGRLNQAARLRKEVAEVYESEYEFEQAAKEYMRAAELYLMEEGVSFANQCYVKAADIMIMLKDVDYELVIETYEKVISEYLKKDLLKGSAKNLIVKVWLCHIAHDDLVGAKNRYSNFSLEDPGFSSSREGELLSSLFNAKEANDVEMYEKSIHGYARITPFDKVNTQLLVHVKDTFSGIATLNLDGNDKALLEPDFT